MEDIMKKFIKAVSLLLLIGASSMLFASGSKEASPAMVAPTATEAAKPVTIEYWTTQTQTDRQATIQLLIDTYQALNPNVTVKLVAVDENDMATQLATAANSKTLPTMIDSGAENIVAFGIDGLMDVDANKAAIDSIGQSKFFEGALKLNESATGEFYGIPAYGWLQGIWYRTDWFAEAGLEAPNTWENIEKAAKYFYRPAENTYGILVGTKAETFAEQCFTPIAQSNGAQLFDAAGNLTFNTPEMKEAVEYYARLAQYNPPGPQTWRARDYYLQGKLAMFFYSTYIMDDLSVQDAAASSLTSENFKDLEGSNFDPQLAEHTGMSPTITNTESASYGVIVSFGLINQGDSAKAKAAEDFVSFLYQPSSYITFLHMAPGGMNPVIKGIADQEDYLNNKILSEYGKDAISDITEGMQDIKSFSIVDGVKMNKASTITTQQIIPQMIYQITQENVSVDKAMATAEAAMKALD
jgi:multiple sugar transport system substrate-binding protein